jgi:hypothetical protein
MTGYITGILRKELNRKTSILIQQYEHRTSINSTAIDRDL